MCQSFLEFHLCHIWRQQFLPMFYSDNYFALLPGEKKEVSFRWKDEDTRGNAPKVVVSGYNVK